MSAKKDSLGEAIGMIAAGIASYARFVCRNPKVGIPVTLIAVLMSCAQIERIIPKSSSKVEKPATVKALPIVEGKAVNEAEGEAKQVKDKSQEKFDLCTKIDQGQVADVNLVAAQEALTLCPWNTEAVNAQIDRKNFADTLQKHTNGIFASEAIGILAPNLYDTRDDLYKAIDGLSIETAESLVAEVLKRQAIANGLSWDDNMINKMSAGIVRGLIDWYN